MDVSAWYKYINTNLCLCLVAREPELTWTCLRQGPLVIIAAPKGLHCNSLTCFHSLDFNDEVPLFEGKNKRVSLTRLTLVISACFSSRVVSAS